MQTVEEILIQQEIPFNLKGADFIVKCLNPEHEDSNPSMRIDQITGVFNCFSCSFKGNLFSLFGATPNLTQIKRESLKRLINRKRAENTGLNLPSGYIPYEGTWRDISQETYTKFEAFTHHGNDFIGRIVFPIRSLSGKIVAFTGRHMSGGTPKYLVTPPKANMPLFPQASPLHGHIILVEGIYDFLNLYDKGITNVVCAFGTRLVTEEKLRMLKIQGVDTVDIFMDGDDPGQKAAKDIQHLCEKAELQHRNISMKGGKDPGSLSLIDAQKLKKTLYDKYSPNRD